MLVCCAAIVLLFAAQLALSVVQNQIDSRPGWWHAVRFPLIDVETGVNASTHFTISAIAFLIALTECGAIWIVAVGYARHADRGIARSFWAAVAGLAVLAVLSPVVGSTDIIEFLEGASLGFAAYNTPPHAFPPALHWVSQQMNYDQFGWIYGPVWTIVNAIVASIPAPTLFARFEVLRIYSALVVAATVWLLWRTSLPRSACAAFAVSPFIWTFLVSDAHVDMQAFVLIACAAVALQRGRAYLAALLVGCAGLVKVPYAFLGGAVFGMTGTLPARLQRWLIALVVAAAGTYLTGEAYMRNLRAFGAFGPFLTSFQDVWAALVLRAVALIGTVGIVVTGKSWLGLLWVIPQGVAPISLPWYLVLAFPAGLVLGAEFAVYLCLTPLTGMLVDLHYDRLPFSRACVAVVIAALATDAIASAKRRRPGAGPPAQR